MAGFVYLTIYQSPFPNRKLVPGEIRFTLHEIRFFLITTPAKPSSKSVEGSGTYANPSKLGYGLGETSIQLPSVVLFDRDSDI